MLEGSEAEKKIALGILHMYIYFVMLRFATD